MQMRRAIFMLFNTNSSIAARRERVQEILFRHSTTFRKRYTPGKNFISIVHFIKAILSLSHDINISRQQREPFFFFTRSSAAKRAADEAQEALNGDGVETE